MEKRKLTKQDIDKVRDIEGFPIGTDEDIIASSDFFLWLIRWAKFISSLHRIFRTIYAHSDNTTKTFLHQVMNGFIQFPFTKRG